MTRRDPSKPPGKHTYVTHGLCVGGKHPLYSAWCQMRARCLKPSSAMFRYYGGRGISVCERWTNSFPDFVADMGPKPSPQYSIDRIDNDGNYEPGNCRWATAFEQVHNRRTRKSPKGERCGAAILTDDCVYAIKRVLVLRRPGATGRKAGLFKHREIAKWFGVHTATITAINIGVSWSHL